MLQGITALYGLSGRLSFGRFCLTLLANLGVSFLLFLVGAMLLHSSRGVGLTLSFTGVLLLPWGLISGLIRLGRAWFVPQPAYRRGDDAFWANYNNGQPDAAADAKGQPMGVLAWIFIVGLFAVALVIGPTIARVFWILSAPTSYAAHTKGDEGLADLAVTDPHALQLLLTRAQAGDRSAMFFYATFFDPEGGICRTAAYQPKDPAVAVYWYEKAVALDDQGAERMLGIDYHYGSGVPQDDVQAAALLERAVAKNDDWAEYWLGTMVEDGEGEAANPARAAMLEQDAAAQGMVLAERKLGSMYFNGTGVTQSQGQAAYYWRQAAARGDVTAKTLLAQNGMTQ